MFIVARMHLLQPCNLFCTRAGTATAAANIKGRIGCTCSWPKKTSPRKPGIPLQANCKTDWLSKRRHLTGFSNLSMIKLDTIPDVHVRM